MIWVTIILGILSALPGIITLIQEIWAAVHGSPAKAHAFIELLSKHRGLHAGSDSVAKSVAEQDFRAFHALHVLGK